MRIGTINARLTHPLDYYQFTRAWLAGRFDRALEQGTPEIASPRSPGAGDSRSSNRRRLGAGVDVSPELLGFMFAACGGGGSGVTSRSIKA